MEKKLISTEVKERHLNNALLVTGPTFFSLSLSLETYLQDSDIHCLSSLQDEGLTDATPYVLLILITTCPQLLILYPVKKIGFGKLYMTLFVK